MKKKPIHTFSFAMNEMAIKPIILGQVKKNKSIVYGAKALMVQIPLGATRQTRDYDIFSDNPRKSARQLERKLDKQFKGNYFYVKEAEHPGTFKVMDHGNDINDTKDDRTVADFTKQPRPLNLVRIDGVNYTHLNEVEKDKRRALSDPQYKFRHPKDRADLERIKFSKLYRRITGL